jgi:hypothetical protein
MKTINPYHGTLPKQIEAILDRIATRIDGAWEYTGSYDALVEALAPTKALLAIYPDGLIFVTQHNSFSSR